MSGYAAHLYHLLPIGSISWYKLSSGYAAHLYRLLPIGSISWYKLLSGYVAHLYSLLPIDSISWYKLSSGSAAHLSPCKGEKERGLLIQTGVYYGWEPEKMILYKVPLARILWGPLKISLSIKSSIKKSGKLSSNLFTLATKHPTYLQIVTFTVVKKSEATSRECQRNLSTCS